MSKQMIINANAAEEIRVAIVENKRLVDLDFEIQSRTKQKGNIYKGIVANVEDSLEAAFIEFGDDKQGFLPLSEIRPGIYPEALKGQKRPKISDVLKRGQEIVVQVTKDEIGSKGAAVTTYLSLPGRFVVLMHSDDSGGGISRKIADEDARRRAREMLSRIEVPDGMAVIIRTAGVNRPRVDLYRDLRALAETWETIDRGAQLGRAPTLLYREPDLIVRTIRDYLAPDIKKVILDSGEEYEEARSYFEDRMPELEDVLELYEGNQPIFEHYGIERAIEELFDREVKLPSGGSICIDPTEALVAVDVNSGKSTKEDDHEATVYKTNLEAARELARQLRLRDLGGIIVVDFIDHASRRHDRDVERVLKDAMRHDKAKVKIGRISENGTLELTRQRLRQAHRLISHTPCPHCEGTGSVRDPEGRALGALRQLHSHVARKRNLAKVTARLPVDVANVLNNSKRRELLYLSEDHDIDVLIVGDAKLSGGEVRIDDERRGRAGLDAAHAVTDPRLAGDKRRGRRRRNKRDEPITPKKSEPPPSIGPVPNFLEDEAGFQALDEAHEADVAEAKRASVQRFDDPLTDALFGDPPDISLDDAEASEAEAPLPPPRKKRRRSRRRRGRKEDGELEGVEGAEAAEAAEGDESADDAEAEATSDDGAPKKKKRRRSRRGGRGRGRKKAEAEAAGEEGASDEAAAEAPSDGEEPAAGETAAGETAAGETAAASDDNGVAEPQKKKRSRSRRAKPAAEAGAVAEQASDADKAPEAEAEAVPADGGEEAPPKPKRTRRRKAAAPADAEAAEASEPTAAEAAEA
jgi:ribonuclease E